MFDVSNANVLTVFIKDKKIYSRFKNYLKIIILVIE